MLLNPKKGSHQLKTSFRGNNIRLTVIQLLENDRNLVNDYNLTGNKPEKKLKFDPDNPSSDPVY